MPAGRDDDREDHHFYFSLDTASDCYFGPLEDEEEMSEQAISDFIKYSKPALFQRLRGLPIKSSAIHQDFSSQDAVRTKRLPTTVTPQAKPQNSLLREHANPQMRATGETSLLSSTRNRIEHKLKNGYSLRRNRYSTRGVRPVCESASCGNRETGANACDMMIIEYDLLNNLDYVPISVIRNEYFCEQCFQRISAAGHSRGSAMTKETDKSLCYDGVDHRTVLDTANRLYAPTNVSPTEKGDLTDANGYEDHAFNYPSNSPKAKLLRAHVQREIHESLLEVAKYEKARKAEFKNKAHTKQDMPQDENLFITRPYYMEPKDQRYRKQGLTRSDYNKDLRLRKELIDRKTEVESPKSPPLLPPLDTISQDKRICHCRDPDDGSEILRCSADLCPIGWFHLRCTDLDHIPTIAEAYYCHYCRTKSGESGIESSSVGASDRSSIDPDTYSLVLLHSAENTQDHCPSTKAVNWTAVNRAEYDSHIVSHNTVPVTQDAATDNLDHGYLASDEFESADEFQYQHDSDVSTLISVSFQETRSVETPGPDADRCATPRSTHPTSPRTPTVAFTPKYVSSKPWGTPVNVSTSPVMRSFDISSPLSPSPTKKRKLDQLEREMCEISLEIPDSEEEGEEGGELVPLMLER